LLSPPIINVPPAIQAIPVTDILPAALEGALLPCPVILLLMANRDGIFDSHETTFLSPVFSIAAIPASWPDLLFCWHDIITPPSINTMK
jgi:hypothetical protein